MNNKDFGFMSEVYKNEFNSCEELVKRFSLIDFVYEKAKESLRLASILTFLLEITIYSLSSLTPISKWIHLYHYLFFNLIFIIILFIFISTFTFQRRFFLIYIIHCILCIIVSSISLMLLYYLKLQFYTYNHSILIIITTSGLFFVCVFYYISNKNKVIGELEEKLIYNINLNKSRVKYLDSLINKIFCLYFTWSDDKMLFLNKSCRDFLETKFYSKYNRTNSNDFDEDVLNQISKSKKYFFKLF